MQQQSGRITFKLPQNFKNSEIIGEIAVYHIGALSVCGCLIHLLFVYCRLYVDSLYYYIIIYYIIHFHYADL